jgi:dihydroorotase
MTVILRNATLADQTKVDIVIAQSLVLEIEPAGSPLTQKREALEATEVIDCSGMYAFSGFVDLHTHLRQPGFEASETVASGSVSAAAGGYTAVMAMANTNPVSDCAEVVELVHDLGLAAGKVAVSPVGAVTRNLAGAELADLAGMHRSRASVKMFSDDGMCVHDEGLMRDALALSAQFGGFIAQHAQAPALTVGAQMNAGPLAVELGLTGWPVEAEESIIRRDIELVRETGGRLHICHLTTAGAVEIVREAKASGLSVTAEVTPHHLLLTEELVRGYDSVFKVNPPLRQATDVAALRAGLMDGTIDVVATDHAPHSAEKKECEWELAAFGMVGLENAASVLHHVLVSEGGFDPALFQRLLSSRPAEIAGLANQGKLEIGAQANITVYNPAEKRVISSKTHSLSSNNPFSGFELPGMVSQVFFAGKQTVRDGVVV